MKVRVCVEMCVEVNDPVFAELSAIHADACGVGESEQYERAISAIEQATGYIFYDDVKDTIDHSEPRITAVYDEEMGTVILEG
jgi:hypothetical protein